MSHCKTYFSPCSLTDDALEVRMLGKLLKNRERNKRKESDQYIFYRLMKSVVWNYGYQVTRDQWRHRKSNYFSDVIENWPISITDYSLWSQQLRKLKKYCTFTFSHGTTERLLSAWSELFDRITVSIHSATFMISYLQFSE